MSGPDVAHFCAYIKLILAYQGAGRGVFDFVEKFVYAYPSDCLKFSIYWPGCGNKTLFHLMTNRTVWRIFNFLRLMASRTIRIIPEVMNN